MDINYLANTRTDHSHNTVSISLKEDMGIYSGKSWSRGHVYRNSMHCSIVSFH